MDEIDCVQWVPGAGQPRTVEWMDLLQKIQAAGKSVWIYDWTVEEIMAYHKELAPDKEWHYPYSGLSDAAEDWNESL